MQSHNAFISAAVSAQKPAGKWDSSSQLWGTIHTQHSPNIRTHNPQQATFLRQMTPAPKPAGKWDSGPPAEPPVLAQECAEALGAAHGDASVLLNDLKELSDEEIERRCRQAGLAVKGGRWVGFYCGCC